MFAKERRSARVLALARAAAPFLGELALVVGAYLAYMYARMLIVSDLGAAAFSNARTIISWEQALGFHWEPHWQSITLESASGIVIFLNWVYILMFLPVIGATAIVLYFMNRGQYIYYRNIVLLTLVFALPMFIIFPVAPPRMLVSQFVDTIGVFGPGFYAGRDAASYINPFAAMPSLHFTWAVIIGYMFFRSGRRWLRVAGVVYPTLMLLAITITGNHYLLDAAAAIPIIVASIVTLQTIELSRAVIAEQQPRLALGGAADATSLFFPLVPRQPDAPDIPIAELR